MSELRKLSKAAVASLIATGLEVVLLLPLLIYVLGVPRAMSYFLVQLAANAVSFLLYKYWAFDAGDHGTLHGQYVRQLVIFGGSLGLNTALPSWMTYRMSVEPVLAFALSNVVVYLGWNYPGNRFWVFRRGSAPGGEGGEAG